MINPINSKTTLTGFYGTLAKKTTESSFDEILDNVNASSDQTNTSGDTMTLKELFTQASEKYDVPYNLLVAVAKAESNFHSTSTSQKGAQGIMQLMPATAKSLGVTDAYDTYQNVMKGAKYLGAHLKAFDQDLDKAIAAYNAGGQAVREYDGVPPYEETQNYVNIVKKYMNEGVTVPDEVVSNTSSTEHVQQATDADWDKATITIGTGDQQTTMTYGAYKRYLELGDLGVG